MHRVALAVLVSLIVSTGCSSRPRNAIVLFDGEDLSKWQSKDGEPAKWKIVEDGAMEVVPKTGDLWTRDKFADCKLHVEFRTPIPAEGDKGQHRGNSGVFLMDRYEIQVLESFGLPPSKGDCAALYSITPPTKNVARPPMEWQTYDITFRAPRHDSAGKKIENGKLTLIWNGEKVHENIEVPSPTRNHKGEEPPGPGPIRLQDHGFAVQYRNIWIVPQGNSK